MSNNTLVYSDRTSGIEKFVGGLYSHLQNHNDIAINYQILLGSEAFETGVITPLLEQHRPPFNLPDPFIVEFTLEKESYALPPTKITVIKLPIQGMQFGTIRPPWMQQWNTNEIRQQYQELNLNKGNALAKLTREDWNIILAYQYLQCDKLLFLLNLYGLDRGDRTELLFEGCDLTKAAEENDVAVIALGTNVIDCKPDRDVVSSRGILDYIWKSRSSVDSELLDKLKDIIASSRYPQWSDILNAIELQNNISFFGVEIPSREPNEDFRPIATEDGGIETGGFENIVEWVD